MTTATAISTEVVFTSHAINCYRERVRPTLPADQVAIALKRIAAHARLVPEAPHWLAGRQREEGSLYLVAGDVVFPLKQSEAGGPWHAVTSISVAALARTRGFAVTQPGGHGGVAGDDRVR